MTEIKQYKKGYSPSALQRKYKLSYNQAADLADYIKELQEKADEYDRCMASYWGMPVDFDIASGTVNKLLDEIKKLKAVV